MLALFYQTRECFSYLRLSEARGPRLEGTTFCFPGPPGPQTMSAFGAKADMAFCGISLSRSLLGVKRTLRFAPHMSAYDPKRTWVANFCCAAQCARMLG
jgi:hypothetical protein